MSLGTCGAAFAAGLGGHLLFDIISYALVAAFGWKIGHRCKNHSHKEK